MNAWATLMSIGLGIWIGIQSCSKDEKLPDKKEIGPIAPGFYKAKLAKNTIIEVFDEYDYRGNVRYTLKEGSAIIEDADGVGFMGLTQNQEGKKRYYDKEQLLHYFSLVNA